MANVNVNDSNTVRAATMLDLISTVVANLDTTDQINKARFLLHVAWHEGARVTARAQSGGGPGRSFFQFEPALAKDAVDYAFQKNWADLLARSSGKTVDELSAAADALSLSPQWPDGNLIESLLLSNDEFGAYLARIALKRLSAAIPIGNHAHAVYWADHWKISFSSRAERLRLIAVVESEADEVDALLTSLLLSRLYRNGPMAMIDPDGYRDAMVLETQKWMGTPYLFGGDSETGIDCSHLVARAIRTIDPDYVYKTVADIRGSGDFVHVNSPKRGDFVSWSDPAHVATAEDPDNGIFIGAQSSTGVARANYLTNPYWSARPGKVFLRYHIVPEGSNRKTSQPAELRVEPEPTVRGLSAEIDVPANGGLGEKIDVSARLTVVVTYATPIPPIQISIIVEDGQGYFQKKDRPELYELPAPDPDSPTTVSLSLMTPLVIELDRPGLHVIQAKWLLSGPFQAIAVASPRPIQID